MSGRSFRRLRRRLLEHGRRSKQLFATGHRRASPVRRLLLRWVTATTVLSLLSLTAYTAYLDHRVRVKFEGKRWSLPARVYARPLELYPGLRLSADRFAREAALLQYRYTSRPQLPGSFFRDGQHFRLVTRSFDFWDATEPGRRVEVVFDGDTVASVTDLADGAPLELLRLEPVMIGGIYPAHNEDRVLVRRSEVPAMLVAALLAVEDRNFYHHHGVVPLSILRALVANLRAGSTVQGGSTLTQQLVKNFYLSNQRTLWRKFNEAIMALELEWHYGKDEILEAYLNEIYLGQDGNRAIHGFGLASQFYFERPLRELKPEQIALLVGIVKGPSFYDPRRYPDRARQRRDLVLDILAEQGYMSSGEALKARQRPLEVVPYRPSGITPHPAFLDLVRRQLRQDYRESDLTSEGLRIFTTMDPLVQLATEGVLGERLSALEAGHSLTAGFLEGAAVVASTETGEVLAVAGGRNPRFAGFNRALDAERQVGSVIKPAVFLTALRQSGQYNLTTLLDDGPLAVDGGTGVSWTPANYDRQNHGMVPLYAALAHSYNVATARLGLTVGIDNVLDTLHRLGVERDLNPYPSLFLGAVDMTPLDVSQMYQTLAAGGFRTPLKAIREVTTSSGEPLQRYALVVQQAFDPTYVYLTTAAMQEAVRSGTGKDLYQGLPATLTVAGKTGTTDDLRDSWFAGFTGDRLAVVWVGNDDNQPTQLTGASGALTVWRDIIARVGAQPLEPVQPPGVEWLWIDPVSGLRAGEGCTNRLQLPFLSDSAPTEYAPCSGTPVEHVLEKTYQWMKGLVR